MLQVLRPAMGLPPTHVTLPAPCPRWLRKPSTAAICREFHRRPIGPSKNCRRPSVDDDPLTPRHQARKQTVASTLLTTFPTPSAAHSPDRTAIPGSPVPHNSPRGS